MSRLRALTGCVLAAGLVAAGYAALFLPGGPLFNSFTLRFVFTGLALLVSAGTVVLVLAAILRRFAHYSPGYRECYEAPAQARQAPGCPCLDVPSSFR